MYSIIRWLDNFSKYEILERNVKEEQCKERAEYWRSHVGGFITWTNKA